MNSIKHPVPFLDTAMHSLLFSFPLHQLPMFFFVLFLEKKPPSLLVEATMLDEVQSHVGMSAECAGGQSAAMRQQKQMGERSTLPRMPSEQKTHVLNSTNILNILLNDLKELIQLLIYFICPCFQVVRRNIPCWLKSLPFLLKKKILDVAGIQGHLTDIQLLTMN